MLRACAMIYGPIGRALLRSDIHRKKAAWERKKNFHPRRKKRSPERESESYIYSALKEAKKSPKLRFSPRNVLTKLGFRLKEKECVIDRTKARQEINSKKWYFAKKPFRSLSRFLSRPRDWSIFSLAYNSNTKSGKARKNNSFFNLDRKILFSWADFHQPAAAQWTRFDIEFNNSAVLYYSSQLIIALRKKKRRQM